MLGAGALAAGVAFAAGQPYFKITGVIEYEWFDSERTNSPVKGPTIAFTCVSGTNQWRIDNDFSANATVQRYFDGTNVFGTSILRTSSDEEIDNETAELIRSNWQVKPMSEEEARTNMVVKVQSTVGGHPFGNMAVNLPWLAFCSGTYLKIPGRIIPPPCADLPVVVDAFAYEDRTDCFDDFMSLPRRITLITSDELHEKSVNDYFFQLRGEQPRKRAGFGDGFLKFQYKATSVTNFAGVHFPLTFSFFQNDWRNDVWYLRFQGRGRITSIEESSRPEGLLKSGIIQCISDFRFRSDEKNVNGLIYVITNNVLPDTNDPILREKFFQSVQKQTQWRNSKSQRQRKSLAWSILALSVVAVSLLVWKDRKQKQTPRP